MSVIRLLPLALLLAFGAACGPLLAPQAGSGDVQFLIADSGSTPRRIDDEALPQGLLVRTMEASNFISSRKIIFSETPLTRGSYKYASWVEPPTDRLSLLLLERLQRAQIFSSVSRLATSAVGDLQLYTELTDFRHDIEESPGMVHVRLRAELVDLHSRAVLCDALFEKHLLAKSYDASGAVSSLVIAANELLDAVVGWTNSCALKFHRSK
jgi:cholesterol transport system auxiliary component